MENKNCICIKYKIVGEPDTKTFLYRNINPKIVDNFQALPDGELERADFTGVLRSIGVLGYLNPIPENTDTSEIWSDINSRLSELPDTNYLIENIKPVNCPKKV